MRRPALTKAAREGLHSILSAIEAGDLMVEGGDLNQSAEMFNKVEAGLRWLRAALAQAEQKARLRAIDRAHK
jgi:exonuclease VII small subunit